jgi:hypothetical protein
MSVEATPIRNRSEMIRGVAVPAGVAAFTGAGWAWNHTLTGLASAETLALHAAIGAAIGLVLGPAARRLCPRAPIAATALVAFLGLGVLPALISETAIPGSRRVAELAQISALAIAATAFAFAAARFGVLVAATVGAIACVATWIATPPSDAVLPAWPVAPVERGTATARQVAVIGIDGGEWSVIDPLLAAGELPHLAGLIERGAAGVLESIEPSYSPVVWTTIFSGKVPEKHGVTGWMVAHGANRRAGVLWDLLGASGLASVVVNVPGTWPPAQMRGVLVSGFPMPTIERAPEIAQKWVLGQVFTAKAFDHALVRTEVLGPAADGVHVQGNVPAGAFQAPLRTRLRHFAIDELERRNIMPAHVKTLEVRYETGSTDTCRFDIAGKRFELAPGAWTDWIDDEEFGHPVRFRATALPGCAIYRTPFFENPLSPIHPITNDPDIFSRAIGSAMYVVEGAGWRMADDFHLRDALVQQLYDVEEQHLAATLQLVKAVPDWSLLVHVFTLTDRLSHAFWRYHEPQAYPSISAAEAKANANRVIDGYRFVDANLGRLLASIPEDTTILVASDHGFHANPALAWGEHRAQGIWIAAGPGVRQSSERQPMSVLSVTPTILAALGFPLAEDMDGMPQPGAIANAASRTIATYETGAPHLAAAKRIDESTVDQLRSLGYVE